MRTSGKCEIELESYLFMYLTKFVLLENFKVKFNQEEGGFLHKNKSKQPSQFIANCFESYL